MQIEREIYEKMIKENLSFAEMTILLEPPISSALLSYHIKKFCKENGLAAPKSKVGRKSKKLDLKFKS